VSLSLWPICNIEARPVTASGLRERQAVNYPRVALRELLMNAVLHRSYESTAPIRFYWFTDRIEIQSPGGLYGEASRRISQTRTATAILCWPRR